ncbi:G/U mismatch-specific DNA glycosylase [Mumia sp. zg.B17]|uniref:G/U mismatch-specific DNA glycosylase n=1 Tax=Mumia sp. zg.B17 TaxID=2855446 RepID=UPI001C6EC91C|nr:G/U mismatch-specific DNA glycosylase [Mumia sp. zg.B17]MBW9205888.1 G/U mismatch-specific DNA glycosylase [Mumia sp. zg.B17]MDD9372156.1 G/U mismatch-specific DNA glycosylase [Acidimicrobiales bacterium]
MDAARGDRPPRPDPAEVAAADGRTIPDWVRPDLRVLFVGLNPGLYSGATGLHFARPGNRFWPALHLSGFTDRRLEPWEHEALLARRLGITNLVARASARAAELSREELVAGGRTLTEKADRWRPAWVAVLGITGYRAAFDDPRTTVGPQDRRLGPSRVWVLPNPSGLNAHYTLPRLAEEFARLREAAERDRPDESE